MGVRESQLSAKFSAITQLSAKFSAISQLSACFVPDGFPRQNVYSRPGCDVSE